MRTSQTTFGGPAVPTEQDRRALITVRDSALAEQWTTSPAVEQFTSWLRLYHDKREAQNGARESPAGFVHFVGLRQLG